MDWITLCGDGTGCWLNIARLPAAADAAAGVMWRSTSLSAGESKRLPSLARRAASTSRLAFCSTLALAAPALQRKHGISASACARQLRRTHYERTVSVSLPKKRKRNGTVVDRSVK